MPETFQHVANLEASERRFHPRQQVLYSHILLDDDNGGIVLNISESGLAMSAVRSLTSDSLHMRFQLSQSSTWIEATGRIAWTNASGQTVGVQFVGLPYEGRIRIRRWLASIDHLSATTKQNPSIEEIAPPVRLAPTTLEPASTVSTPVPPTSAEVIGDAKQDAGDLPESPPADEETEKLELVSQYFRATADPSTIMDGNAPTEEIELEQPASAALESADAASVPEFEAREEVVEMDSEQVPPVASEARDLGTSSQDVEAPSAMPATAENTAPDSHPPLYLSYEEAPPVGSKVGRELASRPGHSRLWIGLLLVALVLLAFFFLGHFVRHAAVNKRSVEVPATASLPTAPPSEPVTPQNPPVSANLKQPLDHPGFLLQVGAMTHKDNADALAEQLRKKDFPAFVSHLEHDRFYYVFVGPYSDVDAMLKAKTGLKKEGFESIQMSRNP